MVNEEVDPSLAIKRLKQEIRELKDEVRWVFLWHEANFMDPAQHAQQSCCCIAVCSNVTLCLILMHAQTYMLCPSRVVLHLGLSLVLSLHLN